MGRNSDSIGLIIALLLAVGALGGGSGRRGQYLFRGFEPAGLIGEFHRMVRLMEKLDSMGQVALNPPKLPEPSQLINTNALPDLDGLMEVMGPLLGGLSGKNDEE